MANSSRKNHTSTNKKNTGNRKPSTTTRSTAQSKASAARKTDTQVAKESIEATNHKKREVHKDIFLLVMLAICLLLFIANFGVGGVVGNAISGFFFGLWGSAEYIFPLLLLVACFFGASNRNNGAVRVKLVCSVILLILVCTLLQLIVNSANHVAIADFGIGKNFMDCFDKKLGGGLFAGMLTKMMVTWFGDVAPYFITVILIIMCIVLITGQSFFAGIKKGGRKISNAVANDIDDYRKEVRHKKREKEFERNKVMTRTNQKVRGVALDTQIPDEGTQTLDLSDIREVHKPEDFYHYEKVEKEESAPTSEESIPQISQKESLMSEDYEKMSQEAVKEDWQHYADEQSNLHDDTVEEYEYTLPPTPSVTKRVRKDYLKPGNTYDGSDEWTTHTEEAKVYETDVLTPSRQDETKDEDIRTNSLDSDKDDLEFTESVLEVQQPAHRTDTDNSVPPAIEESYVPAKALEPKKKVRRYMFPPLNLLSGFNQAASDSATEDFKETENKLNAILGTYGVDAHVVGYSKGPAVTRYDLEPKLGVKVSKVVSLSDEIKLGLAVTNIRIEAPVPGTSYIGIEVPNKKATGVPLAEVLSSKDFRTHKSKLAFSVGKDISGKVVIGDIAKMPHLLIAGTTGSGKSVCINSIIMSILYHASPEEVKLLMVDPKRVELTEYNGIPHLLSPVITDPKKAAAMLNWAVKEMMDRYDLFVKAGCKEFHSYNEKVEQADREHPEVAHPKKLTQIVIIIDELADLMMVAAKEVEESIVRIAQLARAAGIHLILATQSPRADVVTGLIKANVPSKIAFSVSSGMESRIILDTMGAENLLGKGDMLYLPMGESKPRRAQGAFVDESEIAAVVDWVKSHNQEPEYDDQVEESITNPGYVESSIGKAESGADGQDEFLVKAGYAIIEKQRASIGMLQRLFKIGFNRAARIMDELGEMGVVGPEEGTKPRKILMTKEEFDQYMNGGNE